MTSGRLQRWEKILQGIFDRIDDHLEKKYGHRLPLYRTRARHGSATSKSHSGLFNVGAAFSLGIGSRHGRGYVVEVRFATPAEVPFDLQQQVEAEVADLLRVYLSEAMPERDLQVERDGAVYKIVGDLSL
jgi:hypothetical protein